MAGGRTQTIQESALGGTGKQLGKGGEGAIYELEGALSTGQAAVLKKYHTVPSRVSQNHLAKLTGALYSFPPQVRSWILSHSAWPTCLVLNSDQEVAGFIMPRIPSRFFHDFPSKDGFVSGPRDIQYLFEPAHRAEWIGLTLTVKDRYQVLAAIAEGFAILHGAGVTVGDVSPKNLLFSTARSGGVDVFFLDCDSMSIAVSPNPTSIETASWEAPDFVEKGTRESDQYKYALIVLRTLAGDQVTRNLADVPAETPEQVRALLTRALEPDGAVPSFEEWAMLLRRVSRSHAVRELSEPVEESRPAPPASTVSRRVVVAQQQEGVDKPAALPSSVKARSAVPKAKPKKNMTMRVIVILVVVILVVAAGAWSMGYV